MLGLEGAFGTLFNMVKKWGVPAFFGFLGYQNPTAFVDLGDLVNTVVDSFFGESEVTGEATTTTLNIGKIISAIAQIGLGMKWFKGSNFLFSKVLAPYLIGRGVGEIFPAFGIEQPIVL